MANQPFTKRRPALLILGTAAAAAVAWWALAPDSRPRQPAPQLLRERDTSFLETLKRRPTSDDATAPAAAAPADAPLPAAPEAPVTTTFPLPDGLYVCNIWLGSSLITIGKVELRGGAYRGPANEPSGPFEPLSIDGTGQLAWSPHFSQLASTGAVIGRSYVSGKPGAEAFTVEYVTGRGSRESMDCTRG